jgi:cyanophycin synthetase
MDLSQSKGEWKIRIERATHVPLTLGGKAKFMIANVLAATLASYVWGFKTEDISLSYKLSFQALLKHRDE